MVFIESTWNYFARIPFKIRSALAHSQSTVPFEYENEPFFKSYNALREVWIKRKAQRAIADSHNISRQTLKKRETAFVNYGTVGLVPELSFVNIDYRLERLIVLIKSSCLHERACHALRLAEVLQIQGADLELIRLVQRCHGYGQRMDQKELIYFRDLQYILDSVAKHKTRKKGMHDVRQRSKTFFNFDRDHLQ